MHCTNTVSSQWGLSWPAVNEYKTYSDAQVKVYKDDQLISSTDTSVSAQQRPVLTAKTAHPLPIICIFVLLCYVIFFLPILLLL